MNYESADTIVAPATPSGKGALAILRISGPDAIKIADSVWQGKSLLSCNSHTAHLGYIKDEDGTILDQTVATIFIAPNSFTGENSVEFSLHGSLWIVREVINLLIRKGARTAEPGEFSRRAYINGRMDLASAEGIADLISSSSRAAHSLAMKQTRGTFSREFNTLRDKLIQIASLLELELDFSEEEVEFADRTALLNIANELISKIDRLTRSYSAGRAFKEGVPVVIAGVPNVGKSTLLNALLREEKAIVSDIPGTTRDLIEDTCEIGGILFRFIDTAGLRQSSDQIESIGINLARQRLSKASIILWLIDPTTPLDHQISEMKSSAAELTADQILIPVITKAYSPITDSDNLAKAESKISDIANVINSIRPIKISIVEEKGLDSLCELLKGTATYDFNPDTDIVLTNSRHYGNLLKAGEALRRAKNQIENGTSADFIAMDIREAIGALTDLTGSITAPDLLSSIFSSFCIGK